MDGLRYWSGPGGLRWLTEPAARRGLATINVAWSPGTSWR
ncbi:hypothetical protein I547_6581 [Mycobacterium kansasii 824]|nr:hypothetical protein I547_6581 [Mycobacterium kansasii 824]